MALTAIQISVAVTRYLAGESTVKIAKAFGVDPCAIRRALIAKKVKLRNKAEAHELARKRGRAVNPTQGRPRTDAEKAAISAALRERAASLMPPSRYEREIKRRLLARRSANHCKRIRAKAAKASALARDGSKLTRALREHVTGLGYTYQNSRPADMLLINAQNEIVLAVVIDGYHRLKWSDEKREARDQTLRKLAPRVLVVRNACRNTNERLKNLVFTILGATLQSEETWAEYLLDGPGNAKRISKRVGKDSD